MVQAAAAAGLEMARAEAIASRAVTVLDVAAAGVAHSVMVMSIAMVVPVGWHRS